MKYLKTYEEINKNIPKIGDYVILQLDKNYNDTMINFFNNNIGQIRKIRENFEFYKYKIPIKNKIKQEPIIDTEYSIEYENMPENININVNISDIPFDYSNLIKGINVHKDYVKYFSSNKEELITLLSANKYNL
jgi:hypothetical protein